MYDYATTSSTSGSAAVLNQVTGPTANVVMMEGQLGPSYVAWTAPSAGTITSLSMTGWDIHESSSDNDGGIGLYVFNNTNHTYTSPMFSAPDAGLITTTPTATVGTAGVATSAPTGFTLGNNATGVTWSASNIAVTAGEIIYFAADPGHDSGNHDYGGGNDPLALKLSIQFVPEPSSIVLLGLGGIGLALSAWRKRSATA